MVKTRYELVEGNASAFAGLFAVSEFLRKIKFDGLFRENFGDLRRVREFRAVDNLKMLMAVVLSGGERLYDVERLKSDRVLPELFGNGSVPHSTTIRGDLLKFGCLDLEREEFLFRLNEKLLYFVKPKIIIIDIDGTATPVEGHQEGAEKGYCPASPGSRCFQHLIATWDEMKTTLAIETRPGNTHCVNGAIEFIRKVLDRFSHQVDKIIVRCDAGFYSDEILEALEAYENVEYEVSGAKLKHRVGQLDESCFKSYHNSESEYATFYYRMNNGKLRTYYVERTPSNKPQMALYHELEFSYRVIVSNREGKQPHKIFAEYNARGRQEKEICELKNEFALGRIVGHDFELTKAGGWLSALCHTIIGMFRWVAFRKEYRRYQMRRLRFFLFSIVGKFVKHANQKILKLHIPHMGKWRYNKMLERISLC